ncbi:MAG: hypothetical protein ACYDBR_04310, partial [Gaiellaceae bacterium]
MTPNYLVRADGDVVETWSVKRLPFEAKSWEREWKDELKARLRELRARRGAEGGRGSAARRRDVAEGGPRDADRARRRR